MKEGYVLLLSGTIVPYYKESKVGRIDPIKREEDYFQAIKFYLSKGFRVVFVENSDTRSPKILALQSTYPELEYLSFLTKKSHLGKSQGEVEIMKYALENSGFLKSVDYLVKITGRYIIKNMEELMDGTGGFKAQVYINPTRNLRWADSRLMMMTKDYFLSYFIPAVDRYLDEMKGVYMENTFMKSLFVYLLDGGELTLWPVYPSYEGIDGTHNERVAFSAFKSWKYNLYYKFKKFAFKHRA